MTAPHAKGPVHVAHFAGSSDLELDSGEPVAIGLEPGNAQRLGVCWNACEGLPTEEVEELASIGGVAGTFLCLEELRANYRKMIAERDLLCAELSTTKADLDAARALLSAVLKDDDDALTGHGMDTTLADRIRLFMDDTNYLSSGIADHLDVIQRFALQVTNVADILGIVVTIEQRPRLPPAMGNYQTVVSVRPARVRA